MTLPKAPPLPPEVLSKVEPGTDTDTEKSAPLIPTVTKKPEPHSLGGIPNKPIRKKKKKIIKRRKPRTVENTQNVITRPILESTNHTEVFETEDDSSGDEDPPVFKKVDFFKLIGIEPDSGDEYLSQDESTQDHEEEEDIHGDEDIIEELKAQGRSKFYQVRTPETSTTEEMEKFVNNYVRESLKKM